MTKEVPGVFSKARSGYHKELYKKNSVWVRLVSSMMLLRRENRCSRDRVRGRSSRSGSCLASSNLLLFAGGVFCVYL